MSGNERAADFESVEANREPVGEDARFFVDRVRVKPHRPGRPISTERLKLRLNRLDIRPNQARSTALFQLAAEVPAAIVARTLGISVNSAVRWQQISAGDWARRQPRRADLRRIPGDDQRRGGAVTYS